MRQVVRRLWLGAGLTVVALVLWAVLGTDRAAASGTLRVPKAYGQCKGGVGALLIFEDSAGTVRLVDARSGALSTTVSRD
jgi:hypothetical protein